MKSENYISFMTVCGFFIGLICASCNIEDPFLFVAFVAFCTYLFYLAVHLVVINFIDAKKLGSAPLDKAKIDADINQICDALAVREMRIEKLRAQVDEEIALIKASNAKKPTRRPQYEEAA